MHATTSRRSPAIAAFLLLIAAACQGGPATAPTESVDAATAAEVRRLVDAVCEWVSGPAGAKKDRNALLALFVPEGRMLVAATREGGKRVVGSMAVGEFADLIVAEALQHAFYESPIRTRVDAFGGIAMAWSSYEARRAPGEPPFERGVNCFQLARTDDGWRIVSITWTTETATTKLPADMAGG